MVSIYAFERDKPIFFWTSLLLALELLSILAWLFDPLAIIFLVILAVLLLWAYMRDRRYLVLLPLLELFWGSMGKSLHYDFFSLRWLIFLLTILFFVASNYRRLADLKIFKNKKLFIFCLVYFCLVLFLIFLASINHHPWRNIFFDANAYFYFLYLPIWLEYYDQKVFEKLQTLLLVSAHLIAIKTVFTFYIFTQSNFELVSYYKWIRDTRTGEITPLANGFVRIFLQSQIYLLLAWGLKFSQLIKDRLTYKNFLSLLLFSLAIYISLSRSLWLGLALMIFILFLLCVEKWRFIKYFIFLSLATYLSILVLFNVPRYHQLNLFANRTLDTQEAAIATRSILWPIMWQEFKAQPILGHGFAKELTFLSQDPRSKNLDNPTGQRTTFSFEWGWLDFMLKGGLLLPLFFVYSLFYIIRATYAIIKIKPQLGAYVGFFMALALVHFFTPYLNHPLGLGVLAWALINSENHV